MRNDCDILLVNISVCELGFPLYFLLCWIGLRFISMSHLHFLPLDLGMMAALSLGEGGQLPTFHCAWKGSLCLLQHLTSNYSRKQQIRINISLNAETCCLWEFWEADRVLRGQAVVKKSVVSFNQEKWTSQRDSWYIPLDTPAFYFKCSEKVWSLSSGYVMDACNFGSSWEAYLVSLSLLNI